MDSRDAKALKYLQSLLLEQYQDPEEFRECLLGVFRGLIVNEGLGEGVYDAIYQEEAETGEKGWSRYALACFHLAANAEMIYEYAESPIERLFLCCLLAVSLRFGPFFLTITSPIVADALPQKVAEIHQRLISNKQEFHAFHAAIRAGKRFRGKTDIECVCEEILGLKELEQAAFPYLPKHLNAIGREIEKNMDYLTSGLGRSFHVSLQPTFETVRVLGKSIRPDMMIWIPQEPSFKLIVECDGYAYHSDKEAFAADRIRDRALQQAGFQVFRFSGREIMKDATSKANEFVDYLLDLGEQMQARSDEKTQLNRAQRRSAKKGRK